MNPYTPNSAIRPDRYVRRPSPKANGNINPRAYLIVAGILAIVAEYVWFFTCVL